MIMMMAAMADDCVLCATTTALARTITCYGVVIQCIKGVMGLQKVWGTVDCKGVGILEIEKNVWAERMRLQASYQWRCLVVIVNHTQL